MWHGLFTDDPGVADAATAYLVQVGPAYAMLGLGLGLYFGCQGLQTLAVPVLGACVRLTILAGAIGALTIAETLTPAAILWVLVASMVAYGVLVAVGLALGPWSERSNTPINAPVASAATRI